MRFALIISIGSGCAYITDSEYDERVNPRESVAAVACEDPTLYWVDADGDGYGDPEQATENCEPIDGLVDNDFDCDDFDASITVARVLYLDKDGDGYGDPATGRYTCITPDGLTGTAGDCDDTNIDVNPSMAEDCATDVDDDCSGGSNDENAEGCVDTYADADGDGYGGGDAVCLCEVTEDRPTTEALDCDDSRDDVNPTVEEVCSDGVDNNCDGVAPGCGLATTIDPETAFLRIDGDVVPSALGAALNREADITGDGLRDLLIGAHKASRIVVISGSPTDADSALTIGGPDGDDYGRSIGVADLDGDGEPDLIVGAPQASFAGRARAGRVAIHAGPVSTGAALDAGDAIVGGPVGYAYAGRNVATGADMTGDGMPELWIGAIDAKRSGVKVGMAALISGMPESSSVDLSESDAVTARFYGEAGGDKFGVAMLLGADVNGDGMPEAFVGARAAGGGTGMVYGFESGPDLSGDFSATDAAIVITGVGAGARTGETMANPGDIDGDGLDDVLIGAPQRNLAGSRRGAVYVVTEATSGVVTEIAHLEIQSQTDQGHFGSAVSGSGDVDGSGLGIVVGAPNAGAGSVYVFGGGLTGIVTTDDALGSVAGWTEGDRMGSAVLGGVDYNGDFLLDLIVGAEGADDGAGRTAIFVGGGL